MINTFVTEELDILRQAKEYLVGVKAAREQMIELISDMEARG